MPLPDAAITSVAQYFRALSEPMRLRMIHALSAGPRTVSELTIALGCSQANISRHLKVLADTGIVTRKTQGTRSLVSIATGNLEALCQLARERKRTTSRTEHPAASGQPDPD